MTEFLPIENYVPHRGAMLLLDRLLSADDEGAVAEVTVPRDGLFLQDQGMPAWVGLEYMAQTVAAWAGWRALQARQPVKLGFLLGTRKFDSTVDFLAPDTRLTVQVQCELLGDNGLGMFDCTIRVNDDVRATARISVYEPEDGSAYVQALQTTEN
ncbi:ApeP family dehydratase [Diaphorobacter aerolatus]|uniref:Hotdog family protein n=1 Tax=Diaphorobacter aerolatus TaxID=1288495 RepID=A0A7H0GM06_9BURK|nr:hotdog family protein [Diaphorobacter aerolatus]QNP49322.1 hotdog family protein [Diaphorobacter aerolatus]